LNNCEYHDGIGLRVGKRRTLFRHSCA